ncbi:MAG: Rha family transcriptional regulator [Proteobacteria bacterium]|nr:Rha family transcriptional regulator [Pseudomonadota bacterium]
MNAPTLQIALPLAHPLAARQSLFLSTEGQPFTTSRAVAERFRKRHTHVLRAIENLLAEVSDPVFTEPNFGLSDYADSTGRRLPEYRLTHDGFAFLAMRFTGRQAMAWQIAFLQAFNALEAELRARTERYAHALDQVRPALRAVTEGTEAGMNRSQIAAPLGRSVAAVTYHRRNARRLGLLGGAARADGGVAA